jgi:hypothetical protein
MPAQKAHIYMQTFLTDVLRTRYEIKNKGKQQLSDLILLQVLTLILLLVNQALVMGYNLVGNRVSLQKIQKNM